MDKITAQMRADALNHGVDWLCPLDKTVCSNKCYSFVPVYIHETPQDHPNWNLSAPLPSCSNYSVVGEY